jgi:CarboxypepD_reg-like domain/Secretion system C-terminal sorting domain
MSKNIQLTIADPCHENWDNMTQAEKGRFCASCQKQVVDFTNMSDSQLAAFFKKPVQSLSKDGSVCGRFFQDQLERDIEIPRKRIPWVKYFFQFALPAFLFSMKATAQGKVKARVISNTVSAPVCSEIMGDVELTKRRTFIGDTVFTPVQKQKKPLELRLGQISMIKQAIPDAGFIKGKIVDENNYPVSFASVIIKGTKTGTMADANGVFKLENLLEQKEFILQISSVGYEAKEIEISGETDLTKDIVIQLAGQVMGKVVVVGYSSTITRTMVAGAITSIKTEKIKLDTTAIKPPQETPPMIKVYPNPVMSGTNINVGCQKLKEGYYVVQLSNQSGQQVLNKQTWIDAEAQVLNIDIPTVAAGVYFLKLTNKETNKRFTAKVVVE